MRSVLGWRLLVAACAVLVSGCATLETVKNEVATPVKYMFAGASVDSRKNLERGLTQMKGENYEGAVISLNRAIWELERIGDRRLRVEELAVAYQTLGDAYWRLRKRDWAEEHWQLSRELAGAARRGAYPGSAQIAVERGREAYAAARFREALASLQEALVDLEAVTDAQIRVRRLEETRCYLAFTHFALEREDRAREELQRLWVLDASVAFCSREAPPPIRRLIGDLRKRSEARGW